MIHFLHTFTPNPILISFGPFKVYWYGIFIVAGILLAILTTFKLADDYPEIKKDKLIDLAFWLIVGGLVGARVYHVLLEYNYYLSNPIEIFKLWRGGLAIHGGIIAGIIVIYLFNKKNRYNFWLLSSLIVPGLALAQALGRWGNYFNQEIFGKPTDMPWGIPIDIARRPLDYTIFTYFHPTFLYESIGSLFIFFLLITMHKKIKDKKQPFFILVVLTYLVAYSLLRFSLEFIRIDPTPVIFGLRFPQIISLIIIAAAIIYFIWDLKRDQAKLEYFKNLW